MSQSNTKQEPRSFLDRYAKILVVVAVLCGATSGNFGALISAPASVTGFWRLLIALPFFAVPIFAKEESRKKLFAVSKKNLLLAFLSGAFLFGHFFTWYTAVKSTNVASAAGLASFHPGLYLPQKSFVEIHRSNRGRPRRRRLDHVQRSFGVYAGRTDERQPFGLRGGSVHGCLLCLRR